MSMFTLFFVIAAIISGLTHGVSLKRLDFNSPFYQKQPQNRDITGHIVTRDGVLLIAEQTGDENYRTELVRVNAIDGSIEARHVVNMTARKILSVNEDEFLVQPRVGEYESIVSFRVDNLEEGVIHANIALADDLPEWIDCVEWIPGTKNVLYQTFRRFSEADGLLGVVVAAKDGGDLNSTKVWELKGMSTDHVCPFITDDNAIIVHTTNPGRVMKYSLDDGSLLAESSYEPTNFKAVMSPDRKFLYSVEGNAIVRHDTATLEHSILQLIPEANWRGSEYDPLISPDGSTIYYFHLDRNSYGGAFDVISKEGEAIKLWRESFDLPARAGEYPVKNQFVTKDGDFLVLLEARGRLVFRNATTGKEVASYPADTIKDDIYGLDLFTNPEQTTIYLSYGFEIFTETDIISVPFPDMEANTGEYEQSSLDSSGPTRLVLGAIVAGVFSLALSIFCM